VRGQERGDGGGGGADDHESAVVVEVGETEAAVFAGDLDAEGAELGEAGHRVVGDAVVALDREAVDAGFGEGFKGGAELLTAAGQVGVRGGWRVDQAELEVAEVELLAEAGLGPGLLAGRLRDLAGLPLTDLAGGLLRCGCGAGVLRFGVLGHRRRPRPGCRVALTPAPVYRGVTCGAVRRRCGRRAAVGGQTSVRWKFR
jgi:hypothetical protein